ncbi:hypothetical protein PSECIP111951_03223 [Pseudoalteromonas holothuriae]|uniref:DUF721 domain-containing protein n=1 Tax=Pseudoalteromonas holothuriae TaxID=2963714 RepID=A0A9W4VYD8_9GAMM|nr:MULTISPECIES: DUF721 domain-containing protein [unclassified Pseudoalteromonas]CAH9063569.1 hypothetical protein PSECIP111854_03250 [Pseudoalteromonas sp. CIP111854]CAH9064806.1 hypothetical protein PSECIP111951_03223 [Pseudoalteromonas sp. CIP111951]
MAKSRYDPKQLNELMGKWSNKLVNYTDKSKKMAELQQCLEKAIGPILSKKSRVANYRDGTLVIEAASATLATRLNYLKMEILSQFRKAGMIECSQVKITTNPEAQQRLATRQDKGKLQNTQTCNRVMSEQTAEQLKELASNAPPSLQAKLLKLAAHAHNIDKKNDA